VCPLTSEPIEAPILRIQVEPTPENGLGQCIGRLADDDLLRLNRSLLVFLCSWAWPA
jgi:mRNA interferase MazF